MPRKSVRFIRQCRDRGCRKSFRPNGRLNFYCPYCQGKHYEVGRMRNVLKTLERLLRVLGRDKGKRWYKVLARVVIELRSIVKDITKEISNGRK